MEQKTLQGVFIDLLRSELTETEPQIATQELDAETVSALFALSKQHDLAHVISSALYKCGALCDSEMHAKFNREEARSIYRHEQTKYAYSQVTAAFEEAKIPYIPLKGLVLREFYPKPGLRTSCDIDVLVKERDFEMAVSVLTESGFRLGPKNYHDVSLFSSGDVHLELHFNIKELDSRTDEILQNAWQYASAVDGCRYEFTGEFFVFYIYAHIAYHFLSGGCGARSLMDIYIMRHNMGVCFEQAEAMLKSAGIYKFAAELDRLAEICFSGKERDGFDDLLLSYILSGGVYGNEQTKVAMAQGETSTAVRYATGRLLLPLEKMKIAYPILEKCPILLPFCWIARMFKALLGGKTKAVMRELKRANEVTPDQIDEMKTIRNRLGL